MTNRQIPFLFLLLEYQVGDVKHSNVRYLFDIQLRPLLESLRTITPNFLT